MSVSSVYIREIAQGDGQNTRFSFPWKFVATADILVYVDDVLQVSSQYNIDFPITKDNGVVVFKTAPAVGAVVVIRRADNMQQARLFKNQENFNAHEVEKAFDKLTLLVQEGFEELRRGALTMQSQSNLDYTIEDLTIDDGMLALDLATKTYRQTSFTQVQVQKVIDEAIRSADLSVRNQKWDGDTLTITFGDGTTIKGVSSGNVAQLRAQHDDRNHWWLEWSLDGATWHEISGASDVTVHNDLVERNAANAHPIAAITGLTNLLKTLAVKATDFQTGITSQNKGITQAEYKTLDEKIDTAALSGTNIGTYWFGLTGNQSGFVVPNPTSADQNYYDFTTSNFYTAKADLSGWNLAGSNPPPTDIDVNIIISSKFWDITEQNNQQGGMAMWSHTNSKWGYAPRIISFDDANLTGTPTAPDLTDESPDNQIVNKKTLLEHSGGAMPVGAIFTTPRTDTIDGAVEANGGEYNIADYSGEGSIGALLTAGSIAYVSKTEFQTQVANTGVCDSFGWNGGGGTFYGLKNKRLETDRVWTKKANPTVGDLVYDESGIVIPNTTVTAVNGDDISVTETWDGGDSTKTYNVNAEVNFTKTSDPTFLVPKLNPWHIANTAPVVGNGTTLGFTDGTNNFGLWVSDNPGAPIQAYRGLYGQPVGSTSASTANQVNKGAGITTDPDNSGIVADLSETTALRVMVQLATGATDQALETCTSVLGDVSALKEHRVIEFQAPTAANGYTWYRKYADGWVEQGGVIATTASYQNHVVPLPIKMRDGNYSVQKTMHGGANSGTSFAWRALADVESGQINTGTIVNISTPTNSQCLSVFWEIKGMAA